MCCNIQNISKAIDCEKHIPKVRFFKIDGKNFIDENGNKYEIIKTNENLNGATQYELTLKTKH